MEAVLAQPSPWKRLPTAEPCSFSSVMDEELARDLQKEEEIQFPAFSGDIQDAGSAGNVEAPRGGDEVDTSNDFLLAQMLQHELDREHDAQLQMREKHVNAGKKGKRLFGGAVQVFVLCCLALTPISLMLDTKQYNYHSRTTGACLLVNWPMMTKGIAVT